MHPRALLRLVQVLLLVAAIALSGAGLVKIFPATETNVAYASVLAGEEDDDEDDEDEDDEEDVGDDDEDHVVRGQVLEINTIKDPPELVLAGVDGPMVMKVWKTDEIARNGIKIGDHIIARGEKIHEQLFEATELERDDP